jgi:ATP-dependent Clp protease ATP-binding subunit ClpC
MEWLVVAIVTAAIAAFAARSLRRLRDDERAKPSAPAREQAASPAPSPDETLQDLAQAMAPAYESSAHPQDLESNPVFRRGVAWLADPAVPLDHVANYCVGANMPLAAIASEALAEREDSGRAALRVAAFMVHANPWTAHFILRYLGRRAQEPVIGRVLLQARDWWARHPLMPHFLEAFIAERLQRGERADLRAELGTQSPANLDDVLATLERMEGEAAQALRDDLLEWRAARIDLALLGSVGRVWNSAEQRPVIVVTEQLEEALASARAALGRTPPASFLVVGEAGVGKTAFVHALGAQLLAELWTVFEASAADVIAGQTYMGELEQRMRVLLSNLAADKRVVWYVPAFHELFYSGRHRYSPVGLLDLVLPAVEAGRLCVIGEVRPASLEKVLQQRPRLRHAFKSLVLESLPAPATLELAERLVQQDFAPAGVQVDNAVLEDAFELARHHLSASAAPGNLVDLLRQTRQLVTSDTPGGRPMTRSDLLATLAQMTGLPGDVLDDRQRLDRSALRSFFERRVMGQPEAVSCLVDRIVMLKAGLTDPNRPIGVFLFAGPTGTGKTEVAKTLAEFLFGSAQRMIRLDMSEFQETQSLARIVGEPGEAAETDALVNRIRKQPFSVVLLDEFEKANPRVWDLFLQVFDDARLTDASGNLADFRHSIIVLTSNLGAADHRGGSLGFTSSEGVFSEAQVMRVVGNTFRPEFVNRLDRVVVFRPLSRGVMRDILRKELAGVLRRRGFRNREWAVEWEESALEFLLDRGFTRDMGARPLRRAIDQHVLAPIAATIVEHRFPEGDQFLFVRSDGKSIQVEFVDPDAAPEPAAPTGAAPTGYAEIVQAPTGTEQERAFLEAALARVEHRLESLPWQSEKAALLEQMGRPDFWSSPRRHSVLAQIEHRDSLEAGVRTAQSLLRRLSGRPARGSPPAIVSNLAQQLYLIEQALTDLDQGRWPDVFLAIDTVAGERSEDAAAAWAARIATMYGEWARKRRMRAALLHENPGPRQSPPFVLAISGFGAHGILAREAGLHVLEVPDADGGFDRSTARVRLAEQPAQPRPASQSQLEHALACLGGAAAPTAVVRRYREQPSPLVRDAVAGWRTGRIEDVLSGDFDLIS